MCILTLLLRSKSPKMVASPTKAMPFALGSCKKDRKMRNESAPLTTAKRLRSEVWLFQSNLLRNLNMPNTSNIPEIIKIIGWTVSALGKAGLDG